MAMTTVLITDGDNRAALAMTRSLGRSGYRVYVGSATRHSLAGASRYCYRPLRYADPGRHPDRFRSEILSMVRRENIDILMPAAETTTLECMQLNAEIGRDCVIPFQNHASVDRAASKFEVLTLAEQLNIPIPDTCYVHSPKALENAREFCRRVGYPVVVKPSRSRTSGVDGVFNTRAQYAHTGEEFNRIVSAYSDALFPLLIQERVHGNGVGLFACYDRGQPVAYFSHRRIREKPLSGGVSVLRESFPMDVQLKHYAHALLAALKWHGVAMVEFKKDDTSGVLQADGDKRTLLGVTAAGHRRRGRFSRIARAHRRRKNRSSRRVLSVECAHHAGCWAMWMRCLPGCSKKTPS